MRNFELVASVVLATTCFSESFSTFPSFVGPSRAYFGKRSTTLSESAAEEYAKKLQEDSRDLQETLNTEVVASKDDEAADIAEVMLEKAIKIAGAQKDVEMEHMSTADAALEKAIGDEEQAEALLAAAHRDAVGADRQVALVESLDDVYEDTERRRDLSVAHAAHHVEDDAQAKFDSAKKAESKARDEADSAKRTLEIMESSEKELNLMLDHLRKMKGERAIEESNAPSFDSLSEDVVPTAEEQVEQLKGEFKNLQETFMKNLLSKYREVKEHDEDVAADFVDNMLEKAILMTGSQRDVEMEHLSAAESTLSHALGDEERAKALGADAHRTEAGAENQAAMLETMEDDVYDDTERRRDLSVAHAAHHEEDDANALYLSAKKAELRARDMEEEAKRSLEQLKRNEEDLKSILKEFRAERHRKSVEDAGKM